MISVMLPVYNAEKYLKRSIESILTQTERNFELIIVNDGSTDASEDIIMSYQDPRIVYLKKENGGEASARNMALNHLKGDFVVFQDADDISLPNRLETLRRCFNDPNIGFVHSDMLLIDQSEKVLGYFQGLHSPKHNILRQYLKIGNPYHNCSMMVRASILCAFRYENIRIGTDTHMGLKIAQRCESVHIAQPLLFYRIHDQSLMNSPMDTAIQFKATHLVLESFSLKDLVPEIDWESGSMVDNNAKARTILSVILHRRDLIEDSWKWIAMAQSEANKIETNIFIDAVIGMFNGDFKFAALLLEKIKEKDHIIFNYLGELELLQGNKEAAYDYFLRAVTSKPDYDTAIDNIKGLGGSIAFHLMDQAYYKEFKQHLKNNKINLGVPVL